MIHYTYNININNTTLYKTNYASDMPSGKTSWLRN